MAKLKDLIGKEVRLTRRVETRGGTIYPAGMVFRIESVWRGTFALSTGTDDRNIVRNYVNRVSRHAFELIDGGHVPAPGHRPEPIYYNLRLTKREAKFLYSAIGTHWALHPKSGNVAKQCERLSKKMVATGFMKED